MYERIAFMSRNAPAEELMAMPGFFRDHAWPGLTIGNWILDNSLRRKLKMLAAPSICRWPRKNSRCCRDKMVIAGKQAWAPMHRNTIRLLECARRDR